VFFILSKIFSFFLSPFVWILILVVLALILKNKKRARRCLIAGIACFLFFTNSFIADEALRLWEYPLTQDQNLNGTYDAGIVLGGGMVTIDTQYDRMTFHGNTDRMLQALKLYKDGKIKSMMFSSGSGSLVYRDMLEAALIRRFLLKIEVPDSVIMVDSLSDNTHENAVNSAKILKQKFPGGKFLLITSSMHMRRAIACFRNEGVEVTPYSTCMITGDKRKFDFSELLVPDLEAMGHWDNLIHEIAGYVIYAISGYL
jgi:uncharacterized SAM-binding protein YcdF (DUF218 family)